MGYALLPIPQPGWSRPMPTENKPVRRFTIDTTPETFFRLRSLCNERSLAAGRTVSLRTVVTEAIERTLAEAGPPAPKRGG
jgi:hypothetical protein